MNESKEQRVIRFKYVCQLILNTSDIINFYDFIDDIREFLQDFRLVYSTNTLNHNFNGISLSEIEQKCPSLTKYFGGNGLYFYTDDIYKERKKLGSAIFPIDYSISFDKQLAEALRCYEGGKNVSAWDQFHTLIKFIRERDHNFDYTFYMLEESKHLYDTKNERPFNTIRALKRLSYLNPQAFISNPLQPVFDEDRESAGKRAIDLISLYYDSENQNFINGFLLRRKVVYLILLKAALLQWKRNNNFIENLNELIEYSLQYIGKFAKIEVYIMWKLFKYGEQHRFFHPILQPTEKIIDKLSGMSWDLYFISYQETMSTSTQNGLFYIPFIATFDKRFQELVQACPVRFLLIDDKAEIGNIMFFDELEFWEDITTIINNNNDLKTQLAPVNRSLERMAQPYDESKIDQAILDMEEECRKLIKV